MPGPLAMKVAATVRELRLAVGWTQVELARRAGTSQSAVSRVENGHADAVSLDVVDRLLVVLGTEVDLVVRSPFLADRARQRDPAHAAMSSYVRRRLEPDGWQLAPEVEIGSARSRGWIDILGFHPTAQAGLMGELKTELPDAGGAQRQVAWYEREAWIAAQLIGWRPTRFVSALIRLDTSANHRRVRENQELLGQCFPSRARDLATCLANPADADPLGGRALAMVDPLSRRHRWLRATPTDGRRTPAADADYAAFMARMRRRRAA